MMSRNAFQKMSLLDLESCMNHHLLDLEHQPENTSTMMRNGQEMRGNERRRARVCLLVVWGCLGEMEVDQMRVNDEYIVPKP